jgi:arabinose-5-phosphate isomerase
MGNIKLVCFDFDGVFTNSKIYLNDKSFNDKSFNKYYNVKDGMGLALLRQNNIMTCMLSNYKSKLTVTYNDHPEKNIIEHLKFDIINISGNMKIDTLTDIIHKYKFEWNEIAYIGDDVNDIDVMSHVGFSACPNDAVVECKNIVDYVCNTKGGEGCVREFIDIIINNLLNKPINLKNQLRYNYNKILNNITDTMIDTFISNIQNANNIYFCGVGKSGNVAQHMADIMKSINISAHILNCMNTIHGDIGCIKENDVVVFLSNSGNTPEILNVIDHIKVKKCKTILISCNDINMIGPKCDIIITLPKVDEIYCNINCIPTNSIICMITYCNMIASKLTGNINSDIYKSNHPAGMIGYNMKMIKDIIKKEYPKIILNNTVLLNDILLEMTKYSIGCCFFLDMNNKLLGLMTDGDIRRMLINNTEKKYITIDDINVSYYYETDINKKIYMIEKINRYKFIPVLENNMMIGIIPYIKE